MPPKTRSGARRGGRRAPKKNVAQGHAYIKSTFNNTLVTLTAPNGDVISISEAPVPEKKTPTQRQQPMGKARAKKQQTDGRDK